MGRKRREEPDLPEEEEEEEFACEVCRQGDRENILLLCDSCDLGQCIYIYKVVISVGLFVCLSNRNSGTPGPICLKF